MIWLNQLQKSQIGKFKKKNIFPYNDLADDIDSVSDDEEVAGFEEIDMVMVAAGLEGGTGLYLGPWIGPSVGWHSGKA